MTWEEFYSKIGSYLVFVLTLLNSIMLLAIVKTLKII